MTATQLHDLATEVLVPLSVTSALFGAIFVIAIDRLIEGLVVALSGSRRSRRDS